MKSRPIALLCGLLLVAGLAAPAAALDDEHWHKADAAVKRGIEYLRSQQQPDGSWSPKPGPAVTAMVVRVMLDRPEISSADPAAKRGIDYILSKVKPDGGIHDGVLENYNTAICLSALARVNDRPDAAEAIRAAQDYLRSLQWSNQTDPHGKPIDEGHPFYGGAGYGRHGRPDMSNTQIMLEGLYDSGLDCNDPAFQRALVFITRCQASDANTAPWRERLSSDGGFIYATSVNKDRIGEPESFAGEETLDVAGATISRLRSYGSMTYAGFKSYLYANLDRKDQRVVDALNWIRRNYTLTHNPGMTGAQKLHGYYYYLMTFSRALDAWGSSHITTAEDKQHDWANDLIDALTSLQRDDGSWANDVDRWMEGDPVLVTAYALIALQHAMR